MFTKWRTWQKCYENGEYLRSAESGTEANYDMIDGRVDNSVKPKDKGSDKANESPLKADIESIKPVVEKQDNKSKRRESVIKKLREKQVAIAVRDVSRCQNTFSRQSVRNVVIDNMETYKRDEKLFWVFFYGEREEIKVPVRLHILRTKKNFRRSTLNW